MPPRLAANLTDAILPELCLDQGSGLLLLFIGDRDLFDADPLRMRNPLGSEGLEFFDGVLGCELEEGSDEVEALVVGQVGSRFLSKGRSIDILCVTRGHVSKAW